MDTRGERGLSADKAEAESFLSAFLWQNFFDSAVPKRKGAARFGRLPFFVLISVNPL